MDKDHVIEFYEKAVWRPGMKSSDKLTEENIKFLYGTTWFAMWKLHYYYDECVDSMRKVLKRLV